MIYKTKTLFIKTGRTMLYLQCRLYFLPSWQFCNCCKKRKIKQTIYTHNDLESSSRNRSGELLESTRDGMWQRTQFSDCRLTSMLMELEATVSTESSQEHLEHFLKPIGQVYVIGELKGRGLPMRVGDGSQFHKLH